MTSKKRPKLKAIAGSKQSKTNSKPNKSSTKTNNKITKLNIKQVKPSKRQAVKTKSYKTLKIKSNPKRFGLSSLNLGNIFSLSNTKSKNFSTNFMYAGTAVDLKSNTVGDNVKLIYKIDSDNFNITGSATFNQRTFSELHKMFEHLISNIRNLRD